MKLKFRDFSCMLCLVVMAACSTPKNIDYFQDVTTGTIITPAQIKDIRIKPEDKLSIVVSTQDAALSSLFNLTSSGGQPGSSYLGYTTGGAQESYYTVSSNGDINFPVLGKLHIAGMTRNQLSEFIEQKLIAEDLVKQPIVTVEFVNTGIAVIGEVKSPGLYEFNKDHMTIVDAIAMAGDLTIDGVRENVLVLRSIGDGRQEGYRVDLTNLNELAMSPVYYLQQDDVIYVEPNKKSKRDTTSVGNSPFTPAFWISFVSLASTIVTLVITLTRL